MNTKHTPGPWNLETVTTSSGICHKVGPFPPRCEEGRTRHACLYADYPSNFNPSDQELLANARLIAAAPENFDCNKELAAIVRELCATYNHPLPEASLKRSAAAIAKATRSAA